MRDLEILLPFNACRRKLLVTIQQGVSGSELERKFLADEEAFECVDDG